MSIQSLGNTLVTNILHYLGCPPQAPTVRYLNRLIHAYIRKVPWESVSRIIKRHNTLQTKDCPRWPVEFWNDAMEFGFGGTCFESSLAFYSLLVALGYEGYLTVNDMGETRGCHAAIVITFGERKYLVDVTIPVHAAVRIDPQKITRRSTSLLAYTIQPMAENKYQVDRSPHSHRNAFTLIDIPVSLPDYQAIVEDDYHETTGRFLKCVVMTKVINDKTWRFFGDQESYKLESFDRTGKTETSIELQTLPNVLAGLFQIPEDGISAALSCIQDPLFSFTVPDLLREKKQLDA